MALVQMGCGQIVKLNQIAGSDKLKKKLEDMGLTTGVEFTTVMRTRRGPMVIELRGTRLAISKEVASYIDVTPIQN
ncbi:ferrous iron transport protein A [Fusibacter paucivorans]|uniref:Ferrous iron transport protein A n=1 Tax=Fusibacter paucivorans TaxID=76009 RepID=A0ABS5PKG4_9FIRM|nr:FeoA family protein [Fusibacter paucivorans]MBS7525614.1 ferrous iron transport protein A [Fusibacter paucivorans]